jgi:hypothetical protein
VLMEDGDWTDRSTSYADPGLVCDRCYSEIRKFQNRRLRAPLILRRIWRHLTTRSSGP